MRRREQRLLTIGGAFLMCGLLFPALARAEDSQAVSDESRLAQVEPEASEAEPRRVLLAAGIGVGYPGVGLLGTVDVRMIDRLYVGAIGAGAVGDHFATFVGGRVQYRFALGSDLHLGVLGGAGWLDGGNMSGDGNWLAFKDAIKPLIGGTFAYQPNWFMVGADLFVMPATLEHRSEADNGNWEHSRDEASAFAQVSAFVGVAF